MILHPTNTFFLKYRKEKIRKKTNNQWVQTLFIIQSFKKKLSFLSFALQVNKLYANYSSEYAK